MRNAKCNVLITKSRQKSETNPFYEDEEVVKKELMREQAAERAVISEGIPWTDEASALITRVPAFVRPMVIGEVENYARSNGNNEVTRKIVEAVKAKWADSMNYT